MRATILSFTQYSSGTLLYHTCFIIWQKSTSRLIINTIAFQITHEIQECTRVYYSRSAANGYGPSQAYLANHLWMKGLYHESARWYAKAANNKIEEVGSMYFACDLIVL
jgi:TPR repeat protein